jgi:hypothetical protein
MTQQVYRFRMGFMETCYVERDFFVLAATEEEARKKALDNDATDEGEEHSCFPEERNALKVIEACGVDAEATADMQEEG